MSLHIIIDGYNLIRRSPTLSPLDREDLARGREALIELLAAYRKLRPHRITVVFDGATAPLSSERRGMEKGIHVRFSSPGETADTVIRRMARREREKALVVSSDREVTAAAATHAAATIDAEAYEEKLAMAQLMAVKGASLEEEEAGWKPTTRKKGPHRRLPRRQRRNLSKIRKL